MQKNVTNGHYADEFILYIIKRTGGKEDAHWRYQYRRNN